MNHLSLFEIWRPKFSPWPRKKSYRGVSAIRIMELSNPSDHEKIKKYIQEAQLKRNWFRDGLGGNGEISRSISDDGELYFVEIISPRGRREIVAFDDFDNRDSEDKRFGILSGESLDGNYQYWIEAESDRGDVYPDIETLDFEKPR